MKISNYFLIAVGGAVIGAASGFAWRALDDAGQAEIQTPVQSVQVVDVLPNFSYPDLQGRQSSSDEFTDKVVVLNFWATWCPPCRKEMPSLQRMWSALRRDGVELVAIDFGDPADQIQRFARSERITFPLLMDEKGTVLHRYEAVGLPTTFVVDRNGVVTLSHVDVDYTARIEPDEVVAAVQAL